MLAIWHGSKVTQGMLGHCYCPLSPGLDRLSHSGEMSLMAWGLDMPALETSALYFSVNRNSGSIDVR